MKKMKIIIGLSSIVFCLLIFVQVSVISLYNANISGNKLVFGADLYFSISLLIIGLLVFLDRNSKTNRISFIAIGSYALWGLLSLIYLDAFTHNSFYAVISFGCAIILMSEIIIRQKTIKKITS